jgi:pseudouridine-5'-phosphate glycosidase
VREGGAVVALESTLITHGLPYPANVETALAMEAQVRGAGAVPATIAVLRGAITVGLTGTRSSIWGAGPRAASASAAAAISRWPPHYARTLPQRLPGR